MSDAADGFERLGAGALEAGRVWFDLFARAARAAAEAGRVGSGETPPPEGYGSDSAGLLGTLAQAQLAFLAAGVDYGLQLADLQARRGGRIGEQLMGALGDGTLSETERRAVVEEARGYLREVASITMFEARGLARTLAEFDQRLHVQGGGVDDSAPPRRRWRAKD